MNDKLESNIILAISAINNIITIFFGPFLTAYFIKTSKKSILNLSEYYIIAYIILALVSSLISWIIKNKFRIGMFRIGVILKFIYIMAFILLKEKIIKYFWLIAILYGISFGIYWFPYNLFLTNKIKNSDRCTYTVKLNIIESSIGILCPILLGTLITITNYELTALIILILSIIQIMLSFFISKDNKSSLSKYNILKTWKKIKVNKQIKSMLLTELFIGMNISGGALDLLITILIFNSFKTDLNLGIITTISTIISIIGVNIYNKFYKNNNDKKIIILSSIIPVCSLLIIILNRNNFTIILYNLLFVVFTKILSLTRDIRLFNISDSNIIDKNNQCEFLSIREFILAIGRVISYILLLIVGLFNNEIILNIILIILSLSILLTGLNIIKIDKFEN